MITSLLDPETIEEIGKIGELRAPTEACGILLPYPWNGKRIFELPNRSEHHHDKFEMAASDIVITLTKWIEEVEAATWDMITIWHTHPAGQIGPSHDDLHQRSEHCGNLVVSLTDNGPIATWF